MCKTNKFIENDEFLVYKLHGSIENASEVKLIKFKQEDSSPFAFILIYSSRLVITINNNRYAFIFELSKNHCSMWRRMPSYIREKSYLLIT